MPWKRLNAVVRSNAGVRSESGWSKVWVGKNILDLSKNEPPPLSASIVTQTALEVSRICHLYPLESDQIATEELLAEKYAGPGRKARLFRGVDDCIDNLLAAYPGLTPLVFHPTFPGFIERLRAFDRSFVSVNLGPSYRLTDTALDRLTPSNLVLLANPANPTGTCFSQAELQIIARRVGVLLVDQAYIDFASEPQSYEPLAKEGVVTYMSFSKAWGLASFRLGALFGTPEQVNKIREAWPPLERQFPRYSPFDSMSLKLIRNIIQSNVANQCVQQVCIVRSWLIERIRELGLEVPTSHTNFLFLPRWSKDVDLFAELCARKIYGRQLEDIGVRDYMRLSIPDDEGAKRLIKELTEVIGICDQK